LDPGPVAPVGAASGHPPVQELPAAPVAPVDPLEAALSSWWGTDSGTAAAASAPEELVAALFPTPAPESEDDVEAPPSASALDVVEAPDEEATVPADAIALDLDWELAVVADDAPAAETAAAEAGGLELVSLEEGDAAGDVLPELGDHGLELAPLDEAPAPAAEIPEELGLELDWKPSEQLSGDAPAFLSELDLNQDVTALEPAGELLAETEPVAELLPESEPEPVLPELEVVETEFDALPADAYEEAEVSAEEVPPGTAWDSREVALDEVVSPEESTWQAAEPVAETLPEPEYSAPVLPSLQRALDEWRLEDEPDVPEESFSEVVTPNVVSPVEVAETDAPAPVEAPETDTWTSEYILPASVEGEDIFGRINDAWAAPDAAAAESPLEQERAEDLGAFDWHAEPPTAVEAPAAGPAYEVAVPSSNALDWPPLVEPVGEAPAEFEAPAVTAEEEPVAPELYEEPYGYVLPEEADPVPAEAATPPAVDDATVFEDQSYTWQPPIEDAVATLVLEPEAATEDGAGTVEAELEAAQEPDVLWLEPAETVPGVDPEAMAPSRDWVGVVEVIEEWPVEPEVEETTAAPEAPAAEEPLPVDTEEAEADVDIEDVDFDFVPAARGTGDWDTSTDSPLFEEPTAATASTTTDFDDEALARLLGEELPAKPVEARPEAATLEEALTLFADAFSEVELSPPVFPPRHEHVPLEVQVEAPVPIGNWETYGGGLGFDLTPAEEPVVGQTEELSEDILGVSAGSDLLSEDVLYTAEDDAEAPNSQFGAGLEDLWVHEAVSEQLEALEAVEAPTADVSLAELLDTDEALFVDTEELPAAPAEAPSPTPAEADGFDEFEAGLLEALSLFGGAPAPREDSTPSPGDVAETAHDALLTADATGHAEATPPVAFDLEMADGLELEETPVFEEVFPGEPQATEVDEPKSLAPAEEADAETDLYPESETLQVELPGESADAAKPEQDWATLETLPEMSELSADEVVSEEAVAAASVAESAELAPDGGTELLVEGVGKEELAGMPEAAHVQPEAQPEAVGAQWDAPFEGAHELLELQLTGETAQEELAEFEPVRDYAAERLDAELLQMQITGEMQRVQVTAPTDEYFPQLTDDYLTELLERQITGEPTLTEMPEAAIEVSAEVVQSELETAAPEALAENREAAGAMLSEAPAAMDAALLEMETTGEIPQVKAPAEELFLEEETTLDIEAEAPAAMDVALLEMATTGEIPQVEVPAEELFVEEAPVEVAAEAPAEKDVALLGVETTGEIPQVEAPAEALSVEEVPAEVAAEAPAAMDFALLEMETTGEIPQVGVPAEELPVEEASIEVAAEVPAEMDAALLEMETTGENPQVETPAEELPVEEVSVEVAAEAPAEMDVALLEMETTGEIPQVEAPAEELFVEEASIEVAAEAPAEMDVALLEMETTGEIPQVEIQEVGGESAAVEVEAALWSEEVAFTEAEPTEAGEPEPVAAEPFDLEDDVLEAGAPLPYDDAALLALIEGRPPDADEPVVDEDPAVAWDMEAGLEAPAVERPAEEEAGEETAVAFEEEIGLAQEAEQLVTEAEQAVEAPAADAAPDWADTDAEPADAGGDSPAVQEADAWEGDEAPEDPGEEAEEEALPGGHTSTRAAAMAQGLQAWGALQQNPARERREKRAARVKKALAPKAPAPEKQAEQAGKKAMVDALMKFMGP
jgi:hypothetical protein